MKRMFNDTRQSLLERLQDFSGFSRIYSKGFIELSEAQDKELQKALKQVYDSPEVQNHRSYLIKRNMQQFDNAVAKDLPELNLKIEDIKEKPSNNFGW